MSWLRFFLSGMLVLATVKVARADDPGDTAPLYAGKPLAFWQEQINRVHPDSFAARELVPPLLEIIQDTRLATEHRATAGLTLGRIGQPARAALPVLVKLLQAERRNEATTLWVAKSLAKFGREARDATPLLVEFLKDHRLTHLQRQSMLEPLTSIAADHPAAIPGLLAALELPADSSLTETAAAEIRALAAESLLLAGPIHAAAPALMRRLQDEYAEVRRWSAMALGALGEGAEIAQMPLAECMVLDEAKAVRDESALALARTGPEGVKLLRQLLEDREAEVRARAAMALGSLGRQGRVAVPELQARLKDQAPEVRMTALEALWAIQPQAEPLFPSLLAELQSPDRGIQRRALHLLLKFSELPAGGLDQLHELSHNENPAVRRAAAHALRKLQPASPRQLPESVP